MRGSDDEPNEVYEVDVWPCNARALRVFEQCQLSYVGGMSAACIGLSAAEVAAALDGCNIPPNARKGVMRDVIRMGKAAAAWINEQNRKTS